MKNRSIPLRKGSMAANTRSAEMGMIITDAPIDNELLFATFKAGPLREWPIEDIAESSIMRFAQTYLAMAHAKYRPAAPSDGFGNIQLSREQYEDQQRLYQEAVKYACAFVREEDDHSFHIGCSNYSTNRAFVLCIEAARLLAGGSDGNPFAMRLLKLALKEIQAAPGSKS
jgi:hypothetical protein